MCIEKHILVTKMFINELNMGLSLQIEQRSVIKYLLAEKCKPCEIYRRMCDVYVEAGLRQIMITYGLNMSFPP